MVMSLMIENIYITSEIKSMELDDDAADDDFSISDDEQEIVVGNEEAGVLSRKRSLSSTEHHNAAVAGAVAAAAAWPQSPPDHDDESMSLLDRRPLARIITPDRQPSFFMSCPRMTELQVQIERAALRFHDSMRRSDETRAFISQHGGGRHPGLSDDLTVAQSIQSFERAKEYEAVRLQVYGILHTHTPLLRFLTVADALGASGWLIASRTMRSADAKTPFLQVEYRYSHQ